MLHLGGLPTWHRCKESACQCRRCEFDSWVGKIPWRRKWQPIPVFLPEESDGQRSLEDYSPQCRKSWTWLSDRTCTHMPTPSGAVLPKPLVTCSTPLRAASFPVGREGPPRSLHSSTGSWQTRNVVQSSLKRGHPTVITGRRPTSYQWIKLMVRRTLWIEEASCQKSKEEK